MGLITYIGLGLACLYMVQAQLSQQCQNTIAHQVACQEAMHKACDHTCLDEVPAETLAQIQAFMSGGGPPPQQGRKKRQAGPGGQGGPGGLLPEPTEAQIKAMQCMQSHREQVESKCAPEAELEAPDIKCLAAPQFIQCIQIALGQHEQCQQINQQAIECGREVCECIRGELSTLCSVDKSELPPCQITGPPQQG